MNDLTISDESGPLFDNRKDIKKNPNMRACRRSKEKHKADAVAIILRDKYHKTFWQNIKKQEIMASTYGGR